MAITKKKKIIIIIAAVMALLIVGTSVFCGVYFGRITVTPEQFRKDVESKAFYENTLDDRMPQTVIYNIIAEHFNNNTSGKTPKMLFIGYDGCLASMPVLHMDEENSGAKKLKDEGAAYLLYGGGEKIGDQQTSTAPGWATELTGKWATEHGVKSNGDVLNESTRTILYTLAEGGKKVSFNTIWQTHFTTTYKLEKSAAELKGYDIEYKKHKENIEVSNAMIDEIASGEKDVVFGILEYTDGNGHATGFSDKNKNYIKGYIEQDMKAYAMQNAVKSRATYENEDWLIIIASDHGGKLLTHGGKSIMESTVLFITNKKL